MLMGSTGVGKSTFIFYISGCEMKEMRIDGKLKHIGPANP